MKARARLRASLVLVVLVPQCALTPARHLGPVTCIVVGPEGEVYSCSQAGVHVGLGASQRLVCDPPFRVSGLACTRDGTHLLLCGGDVGRRGVLALYTTTGSAVREASLNEDSIHAITLHEAEGRVLAAGADGRIVSLGYPGLDEPRELARHGAAATAIVGRGAWASAGRDGLLHFAANSAAAAVPSSDHSAPVLSLCVDPAANGAARVWSGARDGKVRLHEGTRLLRTWQRLGAAVQALATLGEPDFVYAGLGNGSLVRLGPDATAMQVVASWQGPVTALASAGDHLLVGVGGELIRWPTSVAPLRCEPLRGSHAPPR